MKYTELSAIQIKSLVAILLQYETAFSVTPGDWEGWDIEINIIDEEQEQTVTGEIESITCEF